MTSHLYTVPDSPTVPTPVSFERIGQAIESMGTKLEMIEEGQVGVADFSGFPFLFTFTSGGKFLSIRIVWRSELKMSVPAMSSMFTASDQWNRERYFPTIYALVQEGFIQVVADFICGVEGGLSDTQLVDNISAGVAAGMDAMNFMQSVAETVKMRMPGAAGGAGEPGED
ncbi:MAG: YbjN domain-containing protein [Actinomycetaceae bacterium]|nr:YbjN domain-containing protein [Actinomycetaceae bacterium]